MIKQSPPRFGRRRMDQGMALIVCLALLVLITAAVLAFFARATKNRVVEASRMNRVKTEQLAQSGADYVIGRFLKEISDSANSTIKVVSGQTIYQPKAPTNAVPMRKLSAGIPLTDTNFYNLIRQSASTVDTNASSISTATAARGGRTIGAGRWNAPYLLGGSGFNSTSQLPNWIYVGPDGALTTTVSTNVSGRFAYNVYNEGGLLDANVAGHPSGLSMQDIAAIKGTLAGADLTQLGISQADVDALIAFRNAGSAAPGAYTNMVAQAAKDGADLRVGSTYENNLFTSRQDLIRYALSRNTGLTNALPFLGTWVRSSVTPSFEPDAARPKVSGAVDDLTNPSMMTLRVAKAFTRMDGSTAKVGEPLVKRRFPLSRLAWVGKDGPASGATADQVRQAFGLEFSPSVGWTYVHGSSGAILRLDQVRDLNDAREPDFFEMLQAGLQLGSLAKSAGGTLIAQNRDGLPVNQILQIGANLIDQSDENSTPTTIAFNGSAFHGIENLPYLYRVFLTPYRLHGSSQPSTQDNAGVWFQPEIWNPHAQAATLAADAPTLYRFVMSGTVAAGFGFMTADDNDHLYPEGYSFAPQEILNPDVGIEFGSGVGFSQPVPLQPTNSVASGKNLVTDDALTGFVGIHAGTGAFPDRRITMDPEDNYFKYGTVIFPVPVTFMLQYWNGTRWVTYSQVPAVDIQTYDGDRWTGSEYTKFRRYFPASFYSLIDPRVSRFSVTNGFTENPGPDTRYGPNWKSGLTQRSTADIGAQRHGGVAAWTGWTLGGPNVTGAPQGYFGTLSENLPTSVTRYTDRDGVLRRADGAYVNGSLPEGYPLATNNFESRPVVLNRPFRSLAEMGYASRDIPWKHLDFFTRESGDSALLDLFCLSESSALVEEGPNPTLEAGRVDLNTLQKKVLQAILIDTPKSEANDTISAADAETLATSLVSRTMDPARGPLINRSDLVTKWAQDLSYASKKDTVIKRRREAAIRALADVGNTRTWNLLIDIVAQSGRPSQGNTSVFQIEGEQRCWLHVVIDRTTGRVVSQYSELVYE